MNNSDNTENQTQQHAKSEQLGVFYVSAKKEYRKKIHRLEKNAKNNPDKLKIYRNEKYILGKTPDILQLLGAENVNVVMFHSVQWKAMAVYLNLPPFVSKNGDEKNRHNIPPETMIELPNALNNPIAVFRTQNPRNGEDAFLVLTDLKEPYKDDFKQIVAALHFEIDKTGEKELRIKTVFGRNENQIETGFLKELMYINRDKALTLAKEYGGKVEQAILNVIKFVKTNGDRQVPYGASIAATPENCNQSRQNLFVAVRENDNTLNPIELQEENTAEELPKKRSIQTEQHLNEFRVKLLRQKQEKQQQTTLLQAKETYKTLAKTLNGQDKVRLKMYQDTVTQTIAQEKDPNQKQVAWLHFYQYVAERIKDGKLNLPKPIPIEQAQQMMKQLTQTQTQTIQTPKKHKR